MARVPASSRIAGAPISWGVCEVPGWGYQLPVDTVLEQMRACGLSATEFGPDGFLPEDPSAKAQVLARAGLVAVGQFVPVVLHDARTDPLPQVERAMAGLVAARATTVVVAAATGGEGYDERPELDDAGWATLLGNLDRIDAAARDAGLVATLHPHVGTMIESGDEAQRVLDGSVIGLCLDTGHLLIGGGDPVVIARRHPDRIVHCHLKDVRVDLADAVRRGELTYTEAVSAGMYVPLGQGGVDIRAIVESLEGAGYEGWYVLEQDTILADDPSVTGMDPRTDVDTSVAFIRAVTGAQ